VGLSGELRMVNQLQARLREANALGFTSAVVPHRVGGGEAYPKGMEVIEARSLRQALEAALVVA